MVNAIPYVGRNWVIGGSEPAGFERAQEEMRAWRMGVGGARNRHTSFRSRSYGVRDETCIAGCPTDVYEFVQRVVSGADATWGFVHDSSKSVQFHDARTHTYAHFSLAAHRRGVMVSYVGHRTSRPVGRPVDHKEMSAFFRRIVAGR
jgi:hypothetical protein